MFFSVLFFQVGIRLPGGNIVKREAVHDLTPSECEILGEIFDCWNVSNKVQFPAESGTISNTQLEVDVQGQVLEKSRHKQVSRGGYPARKTSNKAILANHTAYYGMNCKAQNVPVCGAERLPVRLALPFIFHASR